MRVVLFLPLLSSYYTLSWLYIPHTCHFKVLVKSKIICRDLIHNKHINKLFPVAHSVIGWIRGGSRPLSAIIKLHFRFR